MDKSILGNYLSTINPNYYWLNLIDTYLTGKIPLEKFVNKIKVLLWYDKSDPISSSKHNEYINYYTKLVMNEDLNNKSVGIIYTDITELYNININEEYKERLQALEIVLKLKNVNYKICSEKFDSFDILIPLTSFAIFTEEMNNIDKNKLLYIDNNNYTVINNSNQNIDVLKSSYDVIHVIDCYIKYDIFKFYNYNYIIVNNNNKQ